MPKIGDKFHQQVPSPSDASPTEWAADVNEVLQELIDRTAGKVEPSDIVVVSDVEFNGNNATEVGAVRFADRPTVGATNKSLFFSSTNGEFYAKDASGNAVQLTADGLTAVSGTGIITGDASYATVRYTDASQTFNLRERSSGDHAESRQLAIQVADDTDTYFATVDFDGGASNRTLTLSGNLPTTTGWLTLSPAGLVSNSEDHPPSFITTSSTLTCSDADYTTERWRVIPVTQGRCLSSSNVTFTAGSSGNSAYCEFSSTGWFLIDITEFLDDGDIVTGWFITTYKAAGSGGTHTLRGSICYASEDGSIAAPGSLSESISKVLQSGGSATDKAQRYQYTGSDTLTVDKDGATTAPASGADISRTYYMLVECTARVGSANTRFVGVRVKRG